MTVEKLIKLLQELPNQKGEIVCNIKASGRDDELSKIVKTSEKSIRFYRGKDPHLKTKLVTVLETLIER